MQLIEYAESFRFKWYRSPGLHPELIPTLFISTSPIPFSFFFTHDDFTPNEKDGRKRNNRNKKTEFELRQEHYRIYKCYIIHRAWHL